MRLRFLAAGLVLALALPASAQQPAAQQPAPADQAQDPDHPVSFEEQIVVTASRTDQQLVNAPASVSVITNETIQNTPATNMGDLLRAVPGIHISQPATSTSPRAVPRPRWPPRNSRSWTAGACISISSAW